MKGWDGTKIEWHGYHCAQPIIQMGEHKICTLDVEKGGGKQLKDQ